MQVQWLQHLGLVGRSSSRHYWKAEGSAVYDQAFFRQGTRAAIQPQHASKPGLQLTALDAATKPNDLSAPGWRLHALAVELVD